MGTLLNNQLILGPLRAIVPALVAYLIVKFHLPDWLPISEFDAFVVAFISAWWSRQVHAAPPSGGSGGGGGQPSPTPTPTGA